MKQSFFLLLLLLPPAPWSLRAQGKTEPIKPDIDITPVYDPYLSGHQGHVFRAPGDGQMVYLLDEDFEGSFPPAGWTVINPDGARTWSRSTAASGYGSGSACARMNFYDYLPNEGQVDSLLSPVIIGLTPSDSLSFDYAYCAFPNPVVGPDTVELFLSTDGGATFPNLITTLSTADSTAPTNINGWIPSASEWGTRRYPLPSGAVGGSVRLLFVAHNHYAQNFYLDNVRLGTRAVDDVAPMVFGTPPDGGFVVETLPFTPEATFANPGSADQSAPFDVHFLILDTSGTNVYSSTRTIASLTSGSTLEVFFDALAGGLPAGTYRMRAVTALGPDEDRSNDTIAGDFTAELRITGYPYVQHFEGPTEEGWSSKKVTGSKNDWIRGTPRKPIQLRAAHSGLNAWVTNLDTTYENGHNAALFSPFFDLGAITSLHILEFYQNFRIESGWDAAVLEYSTNLGASWLKMDTTLGQGPDYHTVKSRRWYNSRSTYGNVVPPKWSDTSTAYATHDSGWIRSTTSLARMVGQANVRFRWRFRTDGSEVEEGWAIDDVSIVEDTLRTVPVSVHAGWDMVSNPVRTSRDSVLQLFPNSLWPYVVGYWHGGPPGPFYRIENGVGYWGKFAGDALHVIEGAPIDVDTVSVIRGWNMVGPGSLPVDVASITTIPPGILLSDWFGYEGGYATVTKLLPGESYWIKVSSPCGLLLPGSWPAARSRIEEP